MNKWIACLIIGLSLICCDTSSKEKLISKSPASKSESFGLVIHGGAGTILKENMTDSLEMAYRDKLEEAIRAGHKVLADGGTSMKAVTTSINILENSPLFNAGKGAVFTHEGTNELDASVMDGHTLNAGAIAGVTTVKNPIDLALAVMNNSEHVMLSAKGAEKFATEQGIEIVDPSYFYTDRRFKSLQSILEKEKKALEKNQSTPISYLDPFINDYKYGTVGCAALDKFGNLAAGTSTGGMTNKKYNRIGDAPIIGAGTYANNASCAVSSTGWGEYFIRGMVAHDIAAMMEYKEVTLQDAAQEVIQQKLKNLGGTGGIVSIDKNGNVAMEFNTAGMYRAHMNAEGKLIIKIYENE
ncbi:isoaspartyl peptidase/L-asparaginase family protein [Dokdonia sp. Hel_I_53]|uniref:isoaspartyl peptidase/L-asparaginase family protein n=1 Tax=Dokdonia sp. Hel_I_53 TaxID=1566287 RepID=UPI00119903E0|nr:isoaspartyl peptidase/L-asparaginase [Dokdonia sp. Hel_I_53]TVZ52715.1 beta-aspartyl-peptidase (threonine type) [Dokdonia sp. Hel_I_53]